jgi:hypothetical protein
MLAAQIWYKRFTNLLHTVLHTVATLQERTTNVLVWIFNIAVISAQHMRHL